MKLSSIAYNGPVVTVDPNYLEMCRAITSVLRPQCPREWQIWYIKDKIQKRDFTAILGYPMDSTWPSLINIDGQEGEYVTQFQIYRASEIITMIPDAVIERLGGDLQDLSKSRWVKCLIALSSWLARWLSPQLEQPVGLLFMDMTMEEMWLSFLVFERYRMLWEKKTKQWLNK